MVLLLLTACSLCQPLAWEELERSEGADIDGDTADALWRVLDEFIDWSGREDSCVHEVHLRSDYDLWSEGVAAGGRYRHHGGVVEVSTAFEDAEGMLVHELCHAIDHQDGLSQSAPDLFPKGEVELIDDSYADGNELFALECESGAREIDRWRIIEEDCGIDLVDLDLDAQELIQDAVYAGAPRLPWDQPGFPATAGPQWTMPAPDEGWSAQGLEAGRDHLVRLQLPISEATEGSESVDVVIDHLAPNTGQVVASLELAACFRQPERCDVELLPGPGGPYLLATSEREPGEQWLWQLAPGEATLVSAACGGVGWEAVAGGVMWALPYDMEWFGDYSLATDVTLAGCDLATGERFELPVPEPSFPLLGRYLSHAPPRLLFTGEQPTVWWRDAGLSWLDVDGAWHDLELPWHLALQHMASEPGGTLLVHTRSDSAITGDEVLLLARLGPQGGAATTSDMGCLPGVRNGHGYSRRLLAGDGWAVLWEGWGYATDEALYTPLRMD